MRDFKSENFPKMRNEDVKIILNSIFVFLSVFPKWEMKTGVVFPKWEMKIFGILSRKIFHKKPKKKNDFFKIIFVFLNRKKFPKMRNEARKKFKSDFWNFKSENFPKLRNDARKNKILLFVNNLEFESFWCFNILVTYNLKMFILLYLYQ